MNKRNFLIFLCIFTFLGRSLCAAEKDDCSPGLVCNPDHGPLIIAQENGYFADQGLEVAIIALADLCTAKASGSRTVRHCYQLSATITSADCRRTASGQNWHSGRYTLELSSCSGRGSCKNTRRSKGTKNWVFCCRCGRGPFIRDA